MSVWVTDPAYAEIALRLGAALLIGSLIGLERSYHARPAGFRTHVLVCVSTALLMLVTVYESRWFPDASDGARVALDPTRMAQGIMTGIGFLGAGTIMKEGLSVQGLTTAASIWITAAIGVLIGVGFFFPAIIASIITLGSLSSFRWIEHRMPMQFYAHLYLRFAPGEVIEEAALRKMLGDLGFTVARISYRLDRDARYFEYRLIIRAGQREAAQRLTASLSEFEALKAFRVSPSGG